MKICNRCQLLKDRHEFSPRATASDGLVSICKSCANKFSPKNKMSAIAELLETCPTLLKWHNRLTSLYVGDAYVLADKAILRVPDITTKANKQVIRYGEADLVNGVLTTSPTSLYCMLVALKGNTLSGHVVADYVYVLSLRKRIISDIL